MSSLITKNKNDYRDEESICIYAIRDVEIECLHKTGHMEVIQGVWGLLNVLIGMKY